MTADERDPGEEGGDPAPAPWDSVPLYEGRDLARDDLWQLSQKLAKSKRAIARQPPLLPKARKASLSIVTAAIVGAAPAVSFAHPRASGGASAAQAQERAELSAGAKGSLVRKLQKALGVHADGIFGPKTKRAVRAFQKSHGLDVDGVVGPATWNALEAKTAGGAGGLVRLGDAGPAVEKLQRSLGVAADGIFGKKTLKALRTFQRAQGLAVDGIAGPATRAALAASGGSSDGGKHAGMLGLGDQGPAVASMQRALGVPADGIFGPGTRRAVRAFQESNGLVVDGIVGPATLGALGGQGRDTSAAAVAPSAASSADAARSDVDPRLNGALALAAEMGLEVISAYRPGATIASSGNRSDHAYNPSKAIDLHGTPEQMAAYARAVTETGNVQTVIYTPLGMWLSGNGWGSIHSSVTAQEHQDHVHVDTF